MSRLRLISVMSGQPARIYTGLIAFLHGQLRMDFPVDNNQKGMGHQNGAPLIWLSDKVDICC